MQFEQSKGGLFSNLNSLASTLEDTTSTPGVYPLNAGVSISTLKSTSKGESYPLGRVEASKLVLLESTQFLTSAIVASLTASIRLIVFRLGIFI